MLNLWLSRIQNFGQVFNSRHNANSLQPLFNGLQLMEFESIDCVGYLNLNCLCPSIGHHPTRSTQQSIKAVHQPILSPIQYSNEFKLRKYMTTCAVSINHPSGVPPIHSYYFTKALACNESICYLANVRGFKVGLSRLAFFGLERRTVHEKY